MLHIDPASAAADTIPADRPAAARALVDRQLQKLERLAEIGMELAEEAGRQAKATPEAREKSGFAGDPAEIFAKAARTVRMCIALQSKLMKDLADFERADKAERSQRATARKYRIQDYVERAIKVEFGERSAIRVLSDQTREILRDENLLDRIADRPVGEIVARICRDLGLSPEWSVWAAEPWAREAQAADAAAAETNRGGAAGLVSAGFEPPGQPPGISLHNRVKESPG